MDSNLSSNFGAPSHIADFHEHGANLPNQLWDPNRPTQSYKGVFYETGGSMPESGKGPFSAYTNPCTGQVGMGSSGDPNPRFWGGEQFGAPPGPPNNWGPTAG
jgi:hypothetical protein